MLPVTGRDLDGRTSLGEGGTDLDELDGLAPDEGLLIRTAIFISPYYKLPVH
jgi:hypothetical protein